MDRVEASFPEDVDGRELAQAVLAGDDGHLVLGGEQVEQHRLGGVQVGRDQVVVARVARGQFVQQDAPRGCLLYTSRCV